LVRAEDDCYRLFGHLLQGRTTTRGESLNTAILADASQTAVFGRTTPFELTHMATLRPKKNGPLETEQPAQSTSLRQNPENQHLCETGSQGG
jgi:hypothetical protein